MVVLTSLVAQQFLDGADVVAIFQQVGRKRMTKRVAASVFEQSGCTICL